MSITKVKALVQLGNEFGKGTQLSRKKIEEWLDVSPRTAYHYIEELKHQFNAPIVYDSKAKCYYCAAPWSIIEQLRG